MLGLLIVSASSLAEAVELARGCPIYEYDGSVEVRPVQARRPSVSCFSAASTSARAPCR